MDAGEILLDGKPVQIHDTRDAQALGISIIHQELNLMKDLTVAENIFIGREPMNGILLNKRKQNEMAAELLSSLSIDISPTTIVGTLTVARQQMVEIAKALSYDNTRILIMDEPFRGADRKRDRGAVPLHPRFEGARRGHRLHIPPHGRTQGDLRPHHRHGATASISAR